MADPKAIRLMENIYTRVDAMVRAILESWEPAADAYTINVQFENQAGSLSAGAAGQVELPISGRITGARIFVGAGEAASSAQITAQIGSFTDYPTGLILHGTGAIPTLDAEVKADLDIDGWVLTVYTRDILAYQSTSFSGAASHLTLALLVHKLPEVLVSTTVLERRAARLASRMTRSLRNGSVAV